MIFNINKKQLALVILAGVVGAFIGYKLTPGVFCLASLGAPCPLPPTLQYIFIGFLVFGLIAYVMEIIYNALKS